MSPSTRRKLIHFVGGPIAFLVSFVLFAYWTFPYDRLRDWIVQEVERPESSGGVRTPSGYTLEIRSLSPSWVTGVELEGVRFSKLSREPGGRPLVIEADEVDARISLLSLLAGNISLTFDVAIGGGTIEGEFEKTDEATHVEAEVADVDVKRLGILRDLIGLPVTGSLGGSVNVTLALETKNTAGNVDLHVANVNIGDGRAELRRRAGTKGLVIERLGAGRLTLQAEIREGVARISKIEANGSDIEVDGSGTIRLAQPLRMSRAELMLRVKIADGYKNRNTRTRALFELMDFDPELSAAKTPDGALQWRLEGTFGAGLRSTPAGRAPPRTHAARGGGGGGRSGDDDE